MAARLDKLIEKLRRATTPVDVSDMEPLLMAFGWTKARQSGSHCTYVKPEEYPINFPLVSGRKVKPIYVRQMLERLGLD